MRNMLVYLGGLAAIVVVAVGLYQWLGTPKVTVTTEQPAAPAGDAASSDAAKVSADDFVIGKADAPVTIIEYASLTCPHCARFHNEVLPKIKAEYVDTGKARLVYRDFPLDRMALTASALARCAGRERFFGFLGLLFKRQMQWAASSEPMAELAKVAALGGLSQQDIDGCFKDEKLVKEIAQQKFNAAQKFKINATPSFIINGRKFEGEPTFDGFKAAIDPLLPKADK